MASALMAYIAKQGKPREVFKAARYQIEVIFNSADTWIRVKSRKDRIIVFHGLKTPFC